MANETVTRTLESDRPAEAIYRKLLDVSLLPTWAPLFADKVETIAQGKIRITKAGNSSDTDLITHEPSMTVDYLRAMANGKRGGAYIRVMPKPLGGSVIVMTVPVAPNTTPEQVAAGLEDELQALINLV